MLAQPNTAVVLVDLGGRVPRAACLHPTGALIPAGKPAIPLFDTAEFDFLRDPAPWLPLVQGLLVQTARWRTVAPCMAGPRQPVSLLPRHRPYRKTPPTSATSPRRRSCMQAASVFASERPYARYVKR